MLLRRNAKNSKILASLVYVDGQTEQNPVTDINIKVKLPWNT